MYKKLLQKHYEYRFNRHKSELKKNKGIEKTGKLIANYCHCNVRELQNVLKRLMILDNAANNLDDLLYAQSANIHAKGFALSKNQLASSMDILEIAKKQPKDLVSLSFKDTKKKAMGKVEKKVIYFNLHKAG